MIRFELDLVPVFHTVQIPLMTDKLSPKKRQQLERLTRRDTTVIKHYLNIISQEEAGLWREGKEGHRLNVNELDAFTLTSKPLKRRGKDGTLKTTPGRPTVKHDVKHKFADRITTRELKECRDTAVSMWHAYCEQLADHDRIYYRIMAKEKYMDKEDELARVLYWWEREKKPHSPCQAEGYNPAKLPRRANVGTTVFLHKRETQLTRYWLEAYYPEKRKHLWLPLNPSSYHLNQMATGKPKVAQLIKHANGRWYTHITIDVKIPARLDIPRPLAVISIDLGIKKAAVAVLLTADSDGVLKGRDIKFFDQAEKKQVINKLDNKITSLQRRKEHYHQQGRCTDNVTRELRNVANKRREMAKQLDHELTAKIVQWVKRLEHHYNVYVAIGRLKGIRNSRWKGDRKSRKHRGELHRWSFTRITTMLEYKLLWAGIPADRYVTIPESWTSRTCSKCGSTDTHRPFQSLLICRSCGAHLQADINGALNIAFKLIVSLDEAALDHWLINPLLRRKYPERGVKAAGRRSSRTRRKAVLHSKAPSPSLISRPKSRDEFATVVPEAIEPASEKPAQLPEPVQAFSSSCKFV
ncbi:MAG: RNA-guided endonuclease InsQ/TnpB family protein [Candidatus Hodarchaeales archaeon]